MNDSINEIKMNDVDEIEYNNKEQQLIIYTISYFEKSEKQEIQQQVIKTINSFTSDNPISIHSMTVENCAYKIYNYIDFTIVISLRTENNDFYKKSLVNVTTFVLGNIEYKNEEIKLIFSDKIIFVFHFEVLIYCTGFFTHVMNISINDSILQIYKGYSLRNTEIFINKGDSLNKIDRINYFVQGNLRFLNIEKKVEFIRDVIECDSIENNIPLYSILYRDNSMSSTIAHYFQFIPNNDNDFDHEIQIIFAKILTDMINNGFQENKDYKYDEKFYKSLELLKPFDISISNCSGKCKYGYFIKHISKENYLKETKKLIAFDLLLTNQKNHRKSKLIKSIICFCESLVMIYINQCFLKDENLIEELDFCSINRVSSCNEYFRIPLDIKHCIEVDKFHNTGMKFIFTMIIASLTFAQNNWKEFCIFDRQFYYLNKYFKEYQDYISKFYNYDYFDTLIKLRNKCVLNFKKTMKRNILTPKANFTNDLQLFKNYDYYVEPFNDETQIINEYDLVLSSGIIRNLFKELPDEFKNELDGNFKFMYGYSIFKDFQIEKEFNECKTHLDVIKLITKTIIEHLIKISETFSLLID